MIPKNPYFHIKGGVKAKLSASCYNAFSNLNMEVIMKKLFLIALASAFFGMFGSAAWAKETCTTSILPYKYFVEKIAGDTLEVVALVGEGANPHSYEPKPKQMRALEISKLYFATGLEFEHVWLPKFAAQFSNLKVIKTYEGVKRVEMAAHEHEEHAEHEEHEHAEHEHGGLDPHIWLDPILVKQIAKNIAVALASQYPQNAEFYYSNLKSFEAELDALDTQIRETLSNLKSREFIVFHPSWGYFAARYNLVQIPIEIEGKEPKPAALAHLIAEAKEHGVKVIFVAPQFSDRAAREIARESGASVVSINHLAYEWRSELLKSVEAIAKALK